VGCNRIIGIDITAISIVTIINNTYTFNIIAVVLVIVKVMLKVVFLESASGISIGRNMEFPDTDTCCNFGCKKRGILISLTYPPPLIFPAYFFDSNKFNEHSAKEGQVRRT
jgi:hypothetical protein